ncbi:MAG: sel1 repeat family protein [Alphaproteobacteria bacterium]|nr:sel1 repeat family protein [Alphaproteobacteria bacterium]
MFYFVLLFISFFYSVSSAQASDGEPLSKRQTCYHQASVMSSADRDVLFLSADQGVIFSPLYFQSQKFNAQLRAYEKGLSCLYQEVNTLQLEVKERAVKIQLIYLNEVEPLLKKFMDKCQREFIQKYYDGFIDISDLQIGQIQSDFVYWECLNESFQNDKIAYFSLQLLRYGLVQPKKMNGFFPHVFAAISSRAQLGEADALFNLAIICWYGLDDPVDEVKALDFFKAAAAQGNNNARYMLAVIYKTRLPLPENIEKALELLREAAQNGHLPSQQLYFKEFL